MKYRLILADPPWEYQNGGKGNASKYYPTMSDEEIFQLPLERMAADDAVLLLWATWPQIATATKAIMQWGFDYVTGFPWLKTYDRPWVDMFGEPRFRPCYGTGSWVRGSSEPILIAKRKMAKTPKNDFMGLIHQRSYHSKKPNCIYEYAESFPGPYLEMFARRHREGWHAFGNEVENSICLGGLA